MDHNGGDGTGTTTVLLRRRGRRRDLSYDRVAVLQLVAEDEILRQVYPEDDLADAEERLRMFLEQYWGGPRTYSERRGHPRLRMRHAPFRISPIERDAWLRCMHVAVGSIDSHTLDDEHRKELLDYLEMAAHSLVNSMF